MTKAPAVFIAGAFRLELDRGPLVHGWIDQRWVLPPKTDGRQPPARSS